MTLFILFDFCSMPWFLPWILPALLGFALGWALWAKYKGLLADCEAKCKSLDAKIKDLEAEIHTQRNHIADLDGDVALANGKMREAEQALAEAKAELAKMSTAKSDTKGNSSSSSAPAAKTDASSSSALAAKIATGDVSEGHGGNISTSDAFAASIAAAGSLSSPASSTGSNSAYNSFDKTNLQIIEGIGPKMEEVLKSNGIDNWADLAASSPNDLQAILNKYGDQYKIIDPSNWSGQAVLAANGSWEELIKLQHDLDTGAGESKLTKMAIKAGLVKEYKKDDLKIVEGIGPKIEELLHGAGIKTWASLAATSVEKLNEILASAGSRFQMADPSTWPKQAAMADLGNWDELKEYQDFLDGGKE